MQHSPLDLNPTGGITSTETASQNGLYCCYPGCKSDLEAESVACIRGNRNDEDQPCMNRRKFLPRS